MTVREAAIDRIVTAYEALTPAERDIKRGLARDRARNPYADLTQRGAWVIRDTKAHPPDFTNAAPTIHHLGTFGVHRGR